MPYTHLIILYHLPDNGLTYWVSDDVRREDSGHSAAGLQSLSEVIDELRPMADHQTGIVDLMALATAEIDACLGTAEARSRLYQQAIALSDWLSQQPS